MRIVVQNFMGAITGNALRKLSQYVSFWPVNSVGEVSDQKKLCLWEMKDQKNLCLCWKFIHDKKLYLYVSFVLKILSEGNKSYVWPENSVGEKYKQPAEAISSFF